MKDIYVLRVEKLDSKKCRVEYVVPLTNTSENIVGCAVNSFDTNIENFDYFSKHLINPLFAANRKNKGGNRKENKKEAVKTISDHKKIFEK